MAKTKVEVKMVGQNGNAFAIMGRWQAAARKGGWTPAEIKEVIDNATSGDYNYLLATIMEWVKFLEDEETECCDGCGAEALEMRIKAHEAHASVLDLKETFESERRQWRGLTTRLLDALEDMVSLHEEEPDRPAVAYATGLLKENGR